MKNLLWLILTVALIAIGWKLLFADTSVKLGAGVMLLDK